MTELIEITTERLHLRQWMEADREPFSALCADPRVMEFLLPVPNRAACDAAVDAFHAHIAAHGWGFWAVEVRETQQFIGFIGIQVPRTIFPFSPCIEIGWRLAAGHWGKGYATEGAGAALHVGFERLGLAEIIALTTIHNQRSCAVMEKLGMKRAPATFEHPAVPVGHPLREHYLYRLTSEHWAAHA